MREKYEIYDVHEIHEIRMAPSRHCIICPLRQPAWPGGMRGAVESAALVVDKSWRLEPTAESFRYLRPLSSLPTGPVHSAGPTQKYHPADFCDFQKTVAVAEPNAKKNIPQELVPNLHQKCNLQDAL